MLLMKEPFKQGADVRSVAQMIVNTVREPLLVLDDDFNILFSSRSFHRAFQTDAESTHNQNLFALGGAAWDIPALRTLLEKTLPLYDVIEGFEVAHDFPGIGRRVLLLHAHQTPQEEIDSIILLGFEDVTERRALEQERARLQKQSDELVHQKEMLLTEMQHRVLNSLQIIASILISKARAVTSQEAREHLHDAHRRVLSVASVQQHLHPYGRDELVEIASYLTKLCSSLAESMIGDSERTAIAVVADPGSMASADIVSMGFIVTELVINALKYAFPDKKESAAVTVRYEVDGKDWTLSVCDNGVGNSGGKASRVKGGLGTNLVRTLAGQLDAQVKTTSSAEGMCVSVMHNGFRARAIAAA